MPHLQFYFPLDNRSPTRKSTSSFAPLVWAFWKVHLPLLVPCGGANYDWPPMTQWLYILNFNWATFPKLCACVRYGHVIPKARHSSQSVTHTVIVYPCHCLFITGICYTVMSYPCHVLGETISCLWCHSKSDH